MTDTAQVEPLVDAQSSAREALTVTAAAAVAQLVGGFDGWYDTADIAELCAAIVARVEPVQRTTVNLTAAFYARYLTLLKGRTVSAAAPVDITALRGPDITHAGVYGRLADQYRWEISEDVAPADVLEHVVQRADDLVDTDVALAVRDQATASMVKAKVTHYRRVIHPELNREASRSGHAVCGLCIAASDRLYGSHEPMPLHGRCYCTPLPIVGDDDPGSALNNGDLTRLYGAAGGSTQREQLVKTRFQVDQHGELGPVLNAHGAQWRTPEKVRRQTRRTS